MKRTPDKSEHKFDINNLKRMAQLQKRAKFSYVNMYQGKESKKYQSAFRQLKFQQLLEKLSCQPLEVAEIAVLGKNGFGVLATEDIKIKKGGRDRALGIYWGKLVKEGKEDSPYIFTISKNEIDASKYGSWTRFVNHSKGNYNVIAKQKTFVCGKIRVPYIEYALTKSVKAGQQLLVDYGPNYEFDKKHQIFLNPSNGFLNSREVFKLHQDIYVPINGALLASCREVMPDAAKIYMPTPFLQLLAGVKSESVKINKNLSIELPILCVDRRGNVYNDKKQSGMTILMLAAYMGHDAAVRKIIKSFAANIEQQNTRDGYTSLFYAIHSKSNTAKKERIVKQLIDAGIQLSTQDKDGHTALHWCVDAGNLRLLKLLFSDRKSKSDAFETLDIHDRDDLDPITYALKNGKFEIAAYLMRLFEMQYKENIFNKRHNEWLLPVTKKMIAKLDKLPLLKLAIFLMKNGFDTNIEASSVLIHCLKKKGISI